jgi:purine-binding chemotaxis protein CheW
MRQLNFTKTSNDTNTSTIEDHQYLVFTLGQESFAIGILHVKEIIEYGQLTEVPMMPEVVRGVINLRGSVVPVVDLSIRFWKRPLQMGRRSCIVIVELAWEDGKRTMGIMVDSVNKVADIPENDIEPPPSFGSKIRTDFIDGMAKLDSRFVIILNANRVLSLDELTAVANHGELSPGVEPA